MTATSLSQERQEDTVTLHFEIYWYRNQACQDGSTTHPDFNPCLSVSFLKNVVGQQGKDFPCFKISICTVWWKCNDGSLLLVIVGYAVTVVLQGTKAVGGNWGGCGHPIKSKAVGSCLLHWGCFPEAATSCWHSPQSSVYFPHGTGRYEVPSSPSPQPIFLPC